MRGWPWGPRAGKAPLEGVILGRATGGGSRVTKAAPISPGGVRGDELLGAFVTGPVSFCFLPWLVRVRSCVARRAPWAKSIGVPQKGLLRLSSPSLTPVLEAAVPACVERSPFSFQPLLSSPGTGLGFPSRLHFAAGWSRSGLWGLLGRAQDPASIPRLLWRWVPAPGPAPHLFPSPLLVHTARKGKGTRQGKGRECSGAAALPPSCILKLVFGRLGTAAEKCLGVDRGPEHSCGCNHICLRLFSLRNAHVEGGSVVL